MGQYSSPEGLKFYSDAIRNATNIGHYRYGLTYLRVSHLLLHSIISTAFKLELFPLLWKFVGKHSESVFWALLTEIMFLMRGTLPFHMFKNYFPKRDVVPVS